MPLIDMPLTRSNKMTSFLSADEFVDAAISVEPGDSIIYACGDIACDASDCAELSHLRGVVWQYCEQGRGLLTQRKRLDLVRGKHKNAGHQFEYIFTKATPKKQVANV